MKKSNRFLKIIIRIVVVLISVGMLAGIIYSTLEGEYDIYYDYAYALSLCNKDYEGSCCGDVINEQKDKRLPMAVNSECPEGYSLVRPDCIATPLICVQGDKQNNNNTIEKESAPAEQPIAASGAEREAAILEPIKRAGERVTKKAFGTYITEDSSPVQPERFSGYHTGVDYEVFPEELDEDVFVNSVCDGKILQKMNISGYGGVLVISCEIEEGPVTVLYGHINLSSVELEVSDSTEYGAAFARLGDDKSEQTDYERKHLHFAIHKGEDINLLGYVDREAELEGWIDPCFYFCK